MMVRFSVPTDAGNDAVKSGKVGQVFEQIGATYKPEAFYFHLVNGERGGSFVFNMDDSSMLAGVVERLKIGLNAKVEFMPCMAQEDLKKGLGEMGDIIKNFG
jgi:hypothetical protein